MIYLSATSIKDFLKCSKMFYYRKISKESEVDTEDAIAGRIVHKVIEDKWNATELSTLVSYAQEQTKLYNEFSYPFEKIYAKLETYYNAFPEIVSKLSENDLIEYSFAEKISKDVIMRGKIDRVVVSEDLILDWKTGWSTKRNISNDVQFIIYYEMYRRIFGRPPAGVYQVDLNRGRIDTFYPDKKYISTLFDSIIPMMVERINKNKFYKEGYYTGSCYKCGYIGVCNLDP